MPTPRGGPGTAAAGTPCTLALHRETQLGFTWVSLSLDPAVVPEGRFFLRQSGVKHMKGSWAPSGTTVPS